MVAEFQSPPNCSWKLNQFTGESSQKLSEDMSMERVPLVSTSTDVASAPAARERWDVNGSSWQAVRTQITTRCSLHRVSGPWKGALRVLVESENSNCAGTWWHSLGASEKGTVSPPSQKDRASPWAEWLDTNHMEQDRYTDRKREVQMLQVWGTPRDRDLRSCSSNKREPPVWRPWPWK